MVKGKNKHENGNKLLEDIIVGVPTMGMLPATNYLFKVHKKEHKITIPRKGVYSEIDPETYTKEDGEFAILDEKSNVLYLPAISKVLLAVKKYPDLKPNCLFTPIAFVFKKKTVDVIGQVVEMVEPPVDVV